MRISYWSPYFDKIATVKSVKNSIKSILLFSKIPTNIDLLNFYGEWSENKIDEINNKNSKLNYIKFYKSKIIEKLPRNSFMKSRISYFVLFILGIYPLMKYLKKNKPNYLIIHLISSLPLIIMLFFKFETKFILRISGLPKLTFFRRFIWKFSNNKIHKVFVPTQATLENLKKKKIFDENKLFLLRDPVIEIKNIKSDFKKNSVKMDNYFLSIGRLTLQKNHKLLLRAFKEINKENKKFKLVILGDGELKNSLIKLARKLGISENIFFMGNVKNVFEYISKSICVISTSLWEDPGFVMIETAISKKIIISSDCPNGPKEFIGNNLAGYIFKNNDREDLINKIQIFIKDSPRNIFLKKLAAIKKSKNYTLFNHFNSLKKLLNDN